MSSHPLRVALRADASAQIGLGHVKRCLSLAEALQEVGAQVSLVTRELGVDVRALADRAGVDVHMLPAPATTTPLDSTTPYAEWAGVSWRQDADDAYRALEAPRPDWVVVDHYAFDAQWHAAISEMLNARVAAIDDLADRSLAVDLLLDQNYHPDHSLKYAGRLPRGARILGGPRFALLSSAYQRAAPYVFSDAVRSIGIFMGGVDAPNWSSVVMRACREHARFGGEIEIATTSENPHLDALALLARSWPRTTVTRDLGDLAAFFQRHDLQIGAGGGATWERCCMGVPTLALPCARNQETVIAELSKLGAVAAVDAAAMSEAGIGAAVEALVADVERRRGIAQRARALVDSRGGVRAALALAADALSLRRASLEDAALIHSWRNHPLTRRVSGSSAHIDWSSHLDWLKKLLSDRNSLLEIGTIGPLPVGVIRYQGVCGSEAEVSLYLDPTLHGLGLGPHLLRTGEERLRELAPQVQRIAATVLESNAASLSMFTAAGYVRRANGQLIKQLPSR